jgi:hypothetical protein
MEKSNGRVVGAVILSATILFFISANLMAVPGAGTLPAGVTQVCTAYEGDIKYYVHEGETVKKGEPLFFVQRNDIVPKVVELEHNVVYTKLEYERDKKLIKSHSVSEKIYDDSKHKYQEALDAVNLWQAQMAECFYVAPYDCVVIKLLYVQGGGVGDGNPAINIKEIPSAETATKATPVTAEKK